MTKPSGVRLAELVASLSLATDLGLGQPQEHVLRQTVIAQRLAELAGLDDGRRAAVFYVSLLSWVGCVSDSPELARWFGDDVRIRSNGYLVDKAGLPMMRFMIGQIAAGESPLRRLTTVGRFLAGGFRDATSSFVTHCQATGEIADRLDLDATVQHALPHAFERWDGRGAPDGLRGEEIDLVMRVVQIADDVEVHHRLGGPDAASEMLRDRRGTEFDPRLVDLCVAHADDVLAHLDGLDAWDAVIAGCDPLERTLDETQLTAVLETFADYADLKSPWWLGHSRATAALAAEAARRAGLSDGEVTLVERAALVHRLGAIGVSSSIWNRPGPLPAADRERIRTVPYLTERVLSRQPKLAEIGAVAALTRERMDGSGYPRGLTGPAIPMAARVVAAADVYQALGEGRPHREAHVETERADLLRAEGHAGRLDPVAVNAILDAAGHRVRRRVTLVAGLTPREAEVLALAARGLSNRAIAERLSITPRTAGAHLEHVYAKTGLTTRGAAAMFAMRHGLVGPDPEQ